MDENASPEKTSADGPLPPEEAPSAGADTVETATAPAAEALADAASEVVTEPVDQPGEADKTAGRAVGEPERTETSPRPTAAEPERVSLSKKPSIDPSEAGSEDSAGTPAKTPEERDKVSVLLKAVGDAPIMRQKLWMVEPSKPVTWVIKFIQHFLGLPSTEPLLVYVSSAFSPAPDQTIGNLFHCFGTEDKLVLHYCKTQAWG